MSEKHINKSLYESDSTKSPLPCGGGLGVGIMPQGYKQTSIGIIPQDWEVVRLGEVCDFIKTYQNARSDLSDYDEINYIHYGEIHTKYKHFIDFSKAKLPKINAKKLAKETQEIAFCQNGDLVVVDASEDYTAIAKSAEIQNLDSRAVAGLHTFLLRDKAKHFVSGFKGYILYNGEVYKELKRLATGISVLSVSKSNLSNLQIPLPPLKEQEKIARILGVWDSALTSLANLIKAKRKYKTALMQRLLTPPKDKSTHPLAPSAREGEQKVSHRPLAPYMKEFSRAMRKNPTQAENELWQELRGKKLGFRFRRQFVIDSKYIADFVCLEKRLIIECDGGQHSKSICEMESKSPLPCGGDLGVGNDMLNHPDIQRDFILETQNFRILRFWNNEILGNLEGVLSVIKEALESNADFANAKSKSTHPLAPSAREGEQENSLQVNDRESQSSLRFAGFSDKWQEFRLGDIGEIYQPQTIPQSDFTEMGYNVYGANGIIGKYHSYNHEKAQIAIACRGNSCGAVNFTIPKSWITGNAMVINLDNSKVVDKIFAYYTLLNSNLNYLITGSGQPQITGNIKNHKIKLPTLAEQKKIAQVLSACDKEIETLNLKFECLKAQKRGLMQQLLSGKVRVKC